MSPTVRDSGPLADCSVIRLVIEDSVAGVQAAKSAGLYCLAVTHSYPRETLLEAGADHVIDNLTELSRELLGELSRKAHG